MKKGFKSILCGLGLFVIAGFGVGIGIAKENSQLFVTKAEEVETLPCKVVVNSVEHGKVSVDIAEGNVGDICTITAEHDLLYKIDNVSVNGVSLIESQTTSGEFSFSLVEGENVVTAKFVVDEKLCGELTTLVKQATEKDWTNLFTVENVIILVKWVLDSGLLIAIICYFVKDKKLANKIENKVVSVMKTVVPEANKQAIAEAFGKVIEPVVSELKADYFEIMKALNVFAKCFALSQENTPESRRAILDELSSLRIGDLKTIDDIKKAIEEKMAQYEKNYKEALEKIKSIGDLNSKIVENPEVKEDNSNVEEETIINHKQPTE